ncbi:hypothetical protein UVI_02033880 [Ustilaginoidea virens]|uniref:UBA domain-containing protein 3 n=1 Tax=Ustilaginoidea virens TaxID=1159556 RepID=A0A1B5KTP0_USTVR|nr:hypothetical protein UVI_02033880 [Ustilaginoidea virens]
MSGALSKRQQARNEKALHDLVHDVPGNNSCADCHARNPAWASWSLGVFLCMRCAAIHRKLGTHISKVKSLSMDSWSNEQVDNMRKVGNVASNQIYNPEGRKAPVPVDVDEADSAMERFIRQKYIHNVAVGPRKPHSPASDEGTPPPLPPKNSAKFGFRSASSIFPLSSRAKKEQRPGSGAGLSTITSPTHPNKPSKIFGASIDIDEHDDLDRKLAKLGELGFQDGQRNAIVLKGVNGNLDRAIEALVRLGEGRSRSPAPTQLPREAALRSTKSLTPLNSSTSSGSNTLGLSLNNPQKPSLDRPPTSSTTSTNPFDMLPVAQPQTAHSTGTLHHKNPYSNLTNPFGSPSQQVDHVNQAFQGLSVSAAPPPIFPVNGGTMVQLPPPPPQPLHQQSFQQYLSPSAPTSPQGFQHPTYFHSMSTYPPSADQLIQPMPTGYNPFLSQPSSPTTTQHGLTMNAAQNGFANNPFARSPTRIASPILGRIPEQTPSNFIQSTISALPQSLSTPALPFPTNAQQYQQVQMPQFIPQSFSGQQLCHQPPRRDKASIMALYNQPSQICPRPAAAEPSLATGTLGNSSNQDAYTHSTQPTIASNQPPRRASLALPASTNPYASDGFTQPDPFLPNGHVSRESVNLGMDMAWNNGRHSPDAFASLSARHV